MSEITTQARTLDLADLPAVTAAVDRVNRKAVKIGVTGYVLTTGAKGQREIKRFDEVRRVWDVVGYVDTIEVEVLGEAPAYAGWTFVATVTWDGTEYVTRSIPGLEVGPLPALRAKECDHCKAQRDRTDTYLLRHESGEFKQVGSTCIREFLGVEVHLALIGFNPYEGCDSTNRYEPERWSVLSVLVTSLQAIRVYGWVSAGEARDSDHKVATKAHVASALTGTGRYADETRRALKAAATDGDRDEAQVVIDWVRTLEGDSEYVSNLKSVFAQDTFRFDNLGLLVSAPAGYQREQRRNAEQAAQRAALAPSTHQGTVKERLRDLVLTVITAREIHSDYGTTTLLVLRDAAGNAFKWFASNALVDALDTEGNVVGCRAPWVGDTLTLDGTVKAHEVYNGLVSTVLTRCKIKAVTREVAA